MKPIFKEEKLFLEERLKIKLPNNCWRDGTKIYLNSDSKLPLIKFKVQSKQLIIVKNIIKQITENLVTVEYSKNKKIINEVWHNKTLDEEYLQNEESIISKEKESIRKTKEYILQHSDHELRQSDSGGKDSTLTKIISTKAFNEILKESKNISNMINNYKERNIILYDFIIKEVKEKINNYLIDFFNTSNDTAHTYRQVKEHNDKRRLQIHNPKKGWKMWLKVDKNYFIPSIMVRNCCSTYKEGQLNKVLDKKKKYILLLGMRKYESAKRADYDWDLNEAIKKKGKKKLNVPENWKRFLPIVEWEDHEVWLKLIHDDVQFNYMYRLGFERCGCLICPFQNDYTDLLIEKYYPMQWESWMKVLEKNYEIWNIGRLKWTLEEWKQGKWKAGISKEQEIIQNKPTKERIKQLAEIKGISEELAEKYFQRKCSCGKKLNPDEIAMNLKIYGRGMDITKMQCKNCMCEFNQWDKNTYQEKVIQFREQGCNLF